MGQRGPQPKPTESKLLEGTFRKDRAPKNEARPAIEAPPCPEWLDDDARAEWDRIVPQLLSLRLLSQPDLAELVGYCLAFSEVAYCTRFITANGRTVERPGQTPAARPEVAMLYKALEKLRQYASDFGMSPASRSRVEAGPPAEKSKDTAKDFLFRKQA